VHAPQYHETLFSRLYLGSQHSTPAYIPILKDLDRFLKLSPEQKHHCVLRTDAGFGSDANLDYALDEDWHILSKGGGGRRPFALARQVAPDDWLDLGKDSWIAPSVQSPAYVRPVRHWVLRWLTPHQQIKYATLVCSVMEWSAQETAAYYDDRGACETEIRSDKSGLKLCKRRKHSLAAQEALVLLTDLAHNVLAWNAHIMFPEGPLAAFGTTRLIEDVLAIPGHLIIREGRLVEVQLNQNHPHAETTAAGLERLLKHYGHSE